MKSRILGVCSLRRGVKMSEEATLNIPYSITSKT